MLLAPVSQKILGWETSGLGIASLLLGASEFASWRCGVELRECNISLVALRLLVALLPFVPFIQSLNVYRVPSIKLYWVLKIQSWKPLFSVCSIGGERQKVRNSVNVVIGMEWVFGRTLYPTVSPKRTRSTSVLPSVLFFCAYSIFLKNFSSV